MHGRYACGLNQYLYTTGYDHGSNTGRSDTIGNAITPPPCTTNNNANKCIGQ